MIPVTKTFLPSQKEYGSILKRAWDTGWITNRGNLVKELEDRLKNYLKSVSLIAMTNGTLPIQIAIKALGLKGEIITTPFSYVATTSAIVWEDCQPVFVDIHPEYLTIDETKIEESITANTSAILATHVFGNPCNVEVIDTIANKHGLKVIYDAAHCFGVDYKGKSVFNYGDISTCSFHATKLFHTGEGGALFCSDKNLYERCFYHHNFGHKGQEDFHGLGINGKMSELQAAMGLSILPYMEQLMKSRQELVQQYYDGFNGAEIQLMKIREFTEWNCSYFPVVFASESQLLKIREILNAEDIYPRRYFYPSLNDLPYARFMGLGTAKKIASSVLCLPLYDSLSKAEVKRIVDLIRTEL